MQLVYCIHSYIKIVRQHFAVGTKVLLRNMKNSHRMGGKWIENGMAPT